MSVSGVLSAEGLSCVEMKLFALTTVLLPATQMTACKSSGCYCQTSWMRRTSERRSIRLNFSQNGGRSKIIDTAEIGMPVHLASSTSVRTGGSDIPLSVRCLARATTWNKAGDKRLAR